MRSAQQDAEWYRLCSRRSTDYISCHFISAVLALWQVRNIHLGVIRLCIEQKLEGSEPQRFECPYTRAQPE